MKLHSQSTGRTTMAKQTPSAVAEFLAQLPPPRRTELERVRNVVREHLPAGYEETLASGTVVYEVPLERYAELAKAARRR
jgi:hypothetical protein